MEILKDIIDAVTTEVVLGMMCAVAVINISLMRKRKNK